MNTDGKVGIGTLNPNSTKGLTVSGDVLVYGESMFSHPIICFEAVYGHTIVGSYEDEPYIGTGSDYYGYLGHEDKAWYELWVYNAFYDDYASITSDGRLKINVRELEDDVLTKIDKLSPVKYNRIFSDSTENILNETFKDSINNRLKEKRDKYKKEHIGLIAQEVKEIYPEIVNYNEKNDRYSIKYTALIPIIIKGMQEQNEKIAAQQEQINALIKELDGVTNNFDLKSSKFNERITIVTDSKESKLEQNIPNPFSENTLIPYSINEDVNNAVMYVYDMNGKMLHTYPLEAGKGELEIKGNSYQPGMYIYALVCDGKEIDTKRMILTE